MKIAYGVMGYGRGHATRASAVLPALMQHHDVTVYAGNDAYDAMHAQFPTKRIPCIGYRYNQAGRLSIPGTVKENFGVVADLLFGGAGSEFLNDEFTRNRPDVIISDSEAWTLAAARRFGIPTITFDHVSIIAYCLPPLPRDLWWRGHFDGLGYRALIGKPDRLLITSFFSVLPRYDNIKIVGPILRDEVVAREPSNGNYLLAYFNKGQHQFLPHVEMALRQLDMPVVVYGAGREGVEGNLDFRPPSTDGFLDDLAAAKAVLSTCGNNLMGEAHYLRKPVYVIPEDVFEQNINAYMVRRMGMGESGKVENLNAAKLEAFMLNADSYRDKMQPSNGNGRDEAIQILLQTIDELTALQDEAADTPCVTRKHYG